MADRGRLAGHPPCPRRVARNSHGPLIFSTNVAKFFVKLTVLRVLHRSFFRWPRRRTWRLQPDNRSAALWGVIMLKRFLKNESGATAIEYSLIAGLIAMMMFAWVLGFGPYLGIKLAWVFSQIAFAIW